MGKKNRQGQPRGAAEERGGTPLTETETKADQRPPGNPQNRPIDQIVDDASGMAGGASGSSGGGASTLGHPDHDS